MAGNLGIGHILPERHSSHPDFTKSIQYEKEILLHFCLRAEEMQCSSYKVAYQFTKPKHFDDVAIEFEYGGISYSFFIQVSYSETHKRILKNKDFTQERAGNRLYLEKYSRSITENRILTNRICRFILLTNKKVEFSNIETQSEEDLGFTCLFLRLFGNPNNNTMKFQSGIRVKNLKNEEFLIDNEYFLNNFVICHNLPCLENLLSINTQLICDLCQCDTEYAEKIKKNIFQAVNMELPHDEHEQQRPTLDKTFFRECIANSDRRHDFYS